jgi:hypothetical protein
MSRFSLSPKKRALLETLLQEEGLDTSSVAKITGRKDPTSAALSFAQQRLWFIDQLEQGSAAYNISAAVRLVGQLDTTALWQSFAALMARHETLRTAFVTKGGNPVQIIHPIQDIIERPETQPKLIDLRQLPAKEQQIRLQQIAQQEGRRIFDLAHDQLIRVVLVQLADTEHVLIVTMHHIVSDGVSMRVFVQELSVFYRAYVTGVDPALPDLSIQYADYAEWQRQWLKGERLSKQLAYWQQQLDDRPANLSLPIMGAQPTVAHPFQGARQSLVLSPMLTAKLKALGEQVDATPFMTLLAVFKTLLYRYTNQTDILIGTPIANRNHTEIRRLIGFFVNTLVLRTDLSGGPTFQALVQRVREVALGAYDNQDLPFEKLVEEIQPERDLHHTPLFNILVNAVNVPEMTFELPDLAIHPEKLVEPESKFLMTMYIQERKEQLALELVYRAARFSPEQITGMLDQFHFLLEQVVANPTQSIDAYSLVTPTQSELLPDPARA